MAHTSGLRLVRGVWFKAVVSLLISAILVLIFCNIRPAKDFGQQDGAQDFISYLDEFIPKLMDDYDVPGLSIALLKGGETIWTQGYGYADIASGRKMTADTYARVQSISKPVTAWGVMRLVEQGLVELDAPAAQYLGDWSFPESEYNSGGITVRQLLSHTAGMPIGDFYNMYAPGERMPSLRESLFKEAVPFMRPGEAFSYSNTGYNLLELLIEEVTGRDFAEYMQSEVLAPLGMDRASFEWSDAFSQPVATGYNLKGKAVPVYVYPEKASGGLFADAAAVAAFAAAGSPAFSKQRVLSSESIAELYSPQASGLGVYGLVFDAYGMGYYLETLPGGLKAVSHGGQGTGWMTYFYSVPETGDGIVILTNSQRSWPLMAYVLRDWADWSGYSRVGMEAIIAGQTAIWAFMGAVWAAIMLILWGLIEGAALRTSRFALFAKERRIRRMIRFALSIALAIAVLWCAGQDYLFISSVFPRASAWLAGTAFAFSAVLLASAMFVKRNGDGRFEHK